MIEYTTSKTIDDLEGILQLQRSNLAVNLSQEEISSQGFVTVVHRLSDLQNMNEIQQHIIAKDGDKVIAYLLCMTAAAKDDIPVLVPMFEMFDNILYNGKKISNHHFIVVGQVCVANGYRGQGVLDKCYDTYKKELGDNYDFAITEIAARNQRSINAHKRIGFKTVHEYTAPNGEAWHIVLWHWN